jgi:hypothetical protein
MIVIDTGPVVAAANRRDRYHKQCVDLLQNFPGPLLLPSPLLTEIGYMLFSRAGAKAEADFLRDVADGVYELVSVLPPLRLTGLPRSSSGTRTSPWALLTLS